MISMALCEESCVPVDFSHESKLQLCLDDILKAVRNPGIASGIRMKQLSNLFYGKQLNISKPKHGYAHNQYKGGHSYDGMYQYGQKNDYGIYQFQSDNTSETCKIYVGHMKDDEIEGSGLFISVFNKSSPLNSVDINYQCSYEGSFRKEKFQGEGDLKYFNKDGSLFYHYKGKFNNNEKHGYGSITHSNGWSYDGKWKNGKKHGKGKMVFPNGEIYSGDFDNDTMHGNGLTIFPNGDKYDGQYDSMYRDGKGKYTFADQRSYDGDWKADARHGKGTMTYADGSTFKGIYNHGKRREGRMSYTSGDALEGSMEDYIIDGKRETKVKKGTVYVNKEKSKLLGYKPAYDISWKHRNEAEIYQPLKVPEITKGNLKQTTDGDSIKTHVSLSDRSTSSTLTIPRLKENLKYQHTKSPTTPDIVPRTKKEIPINPKVPPGWTMRPYMVWFCAYIIAILVLRTIHDDYDDIEYDDIEPQHGVETRPWACNLGFAYLMSQKCWDVATLNPIFDIEELTRYVME